MGKRWLVVALTLHAACIRDHLVACGELLCPVGYSCDNGICVDPTGLALPAGAIDFNSVACGSTAEITVPMRNAGTTPIVFTVLSSLSNITTDPASGTLTPQTSVDLHVTATAPSESIPNTPISGSLIISTDQEIVERSLTMTTSGALVSTSVQNLDFGESQLPAYAVRTFTLHNTGNVPTNMLVTAPRTPYALPFAPPTELAASSEQTVSIAFAPAIIGASSDTVDLAFSGSQCQQPPSSVALTGSATADPILVDHLTLDFGTAGCGAAATQLPLVLTSNLGSPTPVTTTIDPSSAVVFSSNSGVIPAGPAGMLTLQVSRAAIPLHTPTGLTTSTLQIDGGSVTKMIALKQMIVAPDVSADMLFVNVDTQMTPNGGSGAIGCAPGACTAVVTLTNTGNATALVTVSPTVIPIPGAGTISISPSPLQIPPNNGRSSLIVTLNPGSSPVPGVYRVNFTLATANACSDPITLTVDGSVH